MTRLLVDGRRAWGPVWVPVWGPLQAVGLLIACAALSAAPGGALAEPGISAALPAGPDWDARQWLRRIQEATYKRSFTGTFVVSAGGALSSARITHYCDGHTQIERVDALDGQERTVFRRDDVVHTLWPGSRQAVIEQRDPMSDFPLLSRSGGVDAALPYDAVPERLDRVAGHEAQVLLMRSRDGLRYSQRLWAERSTGLLLRADTLSAQGEVLESSAFSQLLLGARLQPAVLLHAMNHLQGYRVRRPVTLRTELEREGWTLKEPVPGFRSISCVKRAVADAPADARDMLQAIYSDGLTHVSVFIEPHDAASGRSEGWSSVGATGSLAVRRAGWWITVVGDVPAATLQRFADVIERRKP